MPRRLPVYFLIDTSESMAGAPFQQITEGLLALRSSLLSDPRSIETLHLCVITFGAQARVSFPLASILDFDLPHMCLGTGTCLGGALQLLLRSMDTDLQHASSNESRGDWRPIVFVFSDGMPTDSWKVSAKELRSRTDRGKCFTVALACGEDADASALQLLTPNVLRSSSDVSSLGSFFKWITSSIQVASVDVEGAKSLLRNAIPSDLKTVLQSESLLNSDFLYLTPRCSKNNLPYVLKHRREGTKYLGTESVALRELEMSNTKGLEVDISTFQSLPCAHCGNPGLACCSCKQQFCCPSGSGLFTCPWCNLASQFASPEGDFKVDGSGG